MARILVTGAAGFIGFHACRRLLARGDEVIGIDSLNSYYDPALKHARLAQIQDFPGFRFIEMDLADRPRMAALFDVEQPELVVHLGAQAGVRYSIENPAAYIDANLVGFGNVLEGCRRADVRHLAYASSSSVYGSNTKVPFAESDNVDHPVSLYAATKKANEAMAHSYSHIFRLPTTGLRFFTVYGPWGRPDMAAFSFTKALFAGTPIRLFNQGRMRRDFTYVDDVAEGILRTLDRPAAPDPAWTDDPATSSAPWRIYNLGAGEPVELIRFVEILEELTGKTAIKELAPMQPGDVPATYADTSRIETATGFKPHTSIETGLAAFVAWYRGYYQV